MIVERSTTKQRYDESNTLFKGRSDGMKEVSLSNTEIVNKGCRNHKRSNNRHNALEDTRLFQKRFIEDHPRHIISTGSSPEDFNPHLALHSLHDHTRNNRCSSLVCVVRHTQNPTEFDMRAALLQSFGI